MGKRKPTRSATALPTLPDRAIFYDEVDGSLIGSRQEMRRAMDAAAQDDRAWFTLHPEALARLRPFVPAEAPISAARSAVAELPADARRYIPGMRCWYVSAAAILALASRWPLLAEALALLEERTQYQRTYQRRQGSARDTPAHVPAKVADACRALCLTPDAPLGLIETARRYYAKQYHPDTGAHGDLARMQKLNAAADVAEAFARDARDAREAVHL